jgi:hypothetical protein
MIIICDLSFLSLSLSLCGSSPTTKLPERSPTSTNSQKDEEKAYTVLSLLTGGDRTMMMMMMMIA